MSSQEANSEAAAKPGEMWPEVKRAFEKKRFELNLTGAEISRRIEANNNALDENIFKLKHLNFLEVARTKLSSLSPSVANIQNLSSLLFHSNELSAVPPEIGRLEHLKNLDLSNNKLVKLPDDFKNLRELFTLNLNGNQLDSLFPLDELKKLSVLDIGRNKFKYLPQDLGSADLENLSQIDASYNEIVELSDELANLPSLKTLNLENNQLTALPGALCKCVKLKDLLVKENKLKDNRLKKLVEQDKTKAIFEYLEKAYAEQCKNKPKSGPGNVGKSKQAQNQSFQVEYDLIKVFHFNDKNLSSIEIVWDESVDKLRPFIVCAILRDLDLETEGNYKKFLNIQNKIHDDTCQKRTLATIATHDLKQIKTKLFYEAADPESIDLVPLGRKNSITAAEFYAKLMEEAENERKAKKRNQLSGIYKYLTLLTDQDCFAYIRDSEGVISLPPLTNAEKTRISSSTQDVLVEITSSVSIDSCKKVIMELLVECINAGIVSKVKPDVNPTKNQTEEAETGKLRNTVYVQQVKIVDSKGALKTVYPSRVDLDFGNSNKIRVNRDYDEDNK